MSADGRSEDQDLHDAYAEGEVRLAFGQNADRRIVHVSEVVSGLACACVCPACEKPLVAKRGEINEHHFAHHVVSACRHGPETAAHKFAKQLLDETRRIVIPETRATVGERSNLLHEAQRYKFDGAVLEHRLGHIVPDVILRIGDKELLVEIFVTHRCDARKRQRIRELGVSAIEIDLSGFRGASRAELVEAILKTAPREWLFNLHIDRVEAEMRRAEEEAAERTRQAEERRTSRLRSSVAAARSQQPLGPIPVELLNRVRAKDLEAAIGIELPGDFCFVVARAHWQAAIMDRCVLPLDQPAMRRRYDIPSFETKAAFDSVKHLLHLGLVGFIDDETEKRLQESDTRFVRPFRVVVAYLEALRANGFLMKMSFGWTASGRLEQAWSERRERDEKRTRRSNETLDVARAIVAKVPEAERRGFSVEGWYRRVQPAFECSFASCIETDDPSFDEMEAALSAVERMILHRGRIVDELLRLPLKAEARRQAQAREAERRERERRLEESKRRTAEAERLAAEERVRQITEASLETFGSPDWAATPNAALAGATPQVHARESSDKLGEALRIAERERRRREERAAAEERRTALAAMKRSQLVDAVRGRMREDRANVFLNSTHPKIGRQRPIDYCVDERTLEACLSLLGGASSGR